MRKAFLMHLNPDALDEYRRRHSPIWEELGKTLKAHGASRYSIFVDPPRSLLFGYVEIEDEARWNAVAQTEICQKWWHYMADLMATHPDHSPVSEPLSEVFHLD